MAEPGTTMAGGFAGYKLFLLGIPVVASLAGFWLGLRFVPLRKGKELQDVTNRMMACAVSSFVLGPVVLVLLQQYAPGSVQALLALGVLAQLPAGVPFLLLVGSVFLVCSIPGPWLVASVFLYMERRKDKDIGQLVAEVSGKDAKP